MGYWHCSSCAGLTQRNVPTSSSQSSLVHVPRLCRVRSSWMPEQFAATYERGNQYPIGIFPAEQNFIIVQCLMMNVPQALPCSRISLAQSYLILFLLLEQLDPTLLSNPRYQQEPQRWHNCRERESNESWIGIHRDDTHVALNLCCLPDGDVEHVTVI